MSEVEGRDPLVAFARVANATGRSVAVSEFTPAGSTLLDNGVRVHHYRHHRTGRELHLDEPGHAYRETWAPGEGGVAGWVLWEVPTPALLYATGAGEVWEGWANLDANRARGYRPGDRLLKRWEGLLPGSARAVEMMAEDLVARMQGWNREDRSSRPVLSTGDVVVFDHGAVTVTADGFVPVTVAAGDAILDRVWRHCAPEPGSSPSVARTIVDAWVRSAAGGPPGPEQLGPELH